MSMRGRTRFNLVLIVVLVGILWTASSCADQTTTTTMTPTTTTARTTTSVVSSTATSAEPSTTQIGYPPSLMDQPPDDTLFRVKVGDKYGFIDESGSMAIEPRFDHVSSFSEGLAPAAIGDTWGYIDESADFAITVTPEYIDPYPFSNGRALVTRAGSRTLGFIDTRGELVIPPHYHEFGIRSFSEGLAAVHMDQGWGYIDSDGMTVIAPRFKDTVFFSAGLAPATEDGVSWGYIDRTGEWAIPPQFSDSEPPLENMPHTPIAGAFSQDRAVVHMNGGWFYIDMTGKIVSPEFDDALAFSEGLGAVMEGGEWGYVDESGEMIIAPQFERAWQFFDGLAMVELEGKYGYIDPTGAFVIEPQYDRAFNFTGTLAQVYVGDTQMYIDRAGNVVYQGSTMTSAD